MKALVEEIFKIKKTFYDFKHLTNQNMSEFLTGMYALNRELLKSNKAIKIIWPLVLGWIVIDLALWIFLIAIFIGVGIE